MSTEGTTTGPKALTPGVYAVDAACPRCGVIEEILVRIGVVVTIPDDTIGTLKVRLRTKAREHDCRQTRITVATVTASHDATDR